MGPHFPQSVRGFVPQPRHLVRDQAGRSAPTSFGERDNNAAVAALETEGGQARATRLAGNQGGLRGGEYWIAHHRSCA